MEIEHIVNSILEISSNSMKRIDDLVDYIKIEANQNFIKKGNPDKYEYFLTKGVCRSYLLNPEGEEITIAFFTEGSVLSPYIIRTIKGISNINFQAMTEVELGRMDAEGFLNLMVENLEIRDFGNTVLKIELQNKVEKEIEMASLTAKERLINFRNKFQSLENIVPHTTIATYLGITNISLSRLRKELSH